MKALNGLDVTTNTKCVVNCRFCPQDLLHNVYHDTAMLSFEDWKAVLDNVPSDRIKIVFAGFSEPFLNPQCLDMIEYARNKGHPVTLYSTLVGLKPEQVDRLSNVDLTEFILHVPDNMGNAHIPNTSEYRATLTRVFETMRINGYSRMDEHFINNWRAGNCKGSANKHVYGFFHCGWLRHPSFLMLPNCDATVCCMDYGLLHVLGNLKVSTYQEIMDSKEYRRLRRNRFRLDSDDLCRSCTCAYTVSRLPKYLGVKLAFHVYWKLFPQRNPNHVEVKK